MTNREVMQQALEALECMIDDLMYKDHKRVIDISNVAITALRTALAQEHDLARLGQEIEQAEPVAWMFQHDETGRMNYVSNDGIHNPTTFIEMNPRYALVCPLYTAPPAAQPQQQAEPVAYYHPRNGFYWAKPTSIFAPTVVDVPPIPLYTTPPKRPWVGLTDENWEHIHDRKGTALDTFAQGAVWAADQLKEKNT